MKQIAIIPARFGSSRFPGKPLALILGKPLIQWVYEQALQVKDLDGVWVATDDARIQECVESFGGRALMTREDHPSGSDRLAEAARAAQPGPRGHRHQHPGRPAGLPPGPHLPTGRRLCAGTPRRSWSPRCAGRPTSTAAANPNTVKVVFDRAGRALYFSRSPLPFWRDGDSPYFYRHIGIYAYRVQFPQGVRAPAPRPLGSGRKTGAAPGPGARLSHSHRGNHRRHPGGGHARKTPGRWRSFSGAIV